MLQIGQRAIYQKDIKSAILETSKNGFEVLEIHLSSPQFMPENYSLKQINKIKKIAQENNVILQFHAPLEHSLIFTNQEMHSSALKRIDKMIAFSQKVKARCLTLHPGKVAMYNLADGTKLKDDDIYSEFYQKLFEDSVKHIVSVSPADLFVCIENTDNFTANYQNILEKYLKTKKIFLTWDIRKNYTYDTNELIKEQWRFVNKNKSCVKNLHVSGFDNAHSQLKGWEEKIIPFLKLFNNQTLPIIIEIMPLKQTIKAKNIFERMVASNAK